MGEESEEAGARAMGGARAGPSVLAISSCQAASGAFPASPALALALGLGPGLLEGRGEGWATALALATLETRCAEGREEWELVVGKGRRWLVARGEEGLVEVARGILQGMACDQGHGLQVREMREHTDRLTQKQTDMETD